MLHSIKMFISNSTRDIFQQHLKETDPLLVRIQRNEENEENEENNNSYLFMSLILVPFALFVTITICVVLIVL
jgi:hypothetical protein